MAGDNKQKECKHCMTLISRRASVCPQCRNSVARFSGLVSLVRNGAWFVTATVSLGFAAVEKWENSDLSKELRSAEKVVTQKESTITQKEHEITRKEHEITQKDIEAKVLRRKVFESPSGDEIMGPAQYTPSYPDVAARHDALKAELARTEQQLRTIEEQIEKMVKGREKPDREALYELERQKLENQIKLQELRKRFANLG